MAHFLGLYRNSIQVTEVDYIPSIFIRIHLTEYSKVIKHTTLTIIESVADKTMHYH